MFGNSKKDFDCVKMKDAALKIIMKRLSVMTEAEQLEYWRKGTEKLKKEIEAAKARRAESAASRHKI